MYDYYTAIITRVCVSRRWNILARRRLGANARAARTTDESSTRRSLLRDLRRGRLHDDHLRLLTGHRGRGLPRVHLSAHLALQARGATTPLEECDRLGHPHAEQRVLQDRLGVARVAPQTPDRVRDEARAVAIAALRALRDRPEMARSAVRRVQAIAAIFRASEERVVHRDKCIVGHDREVLTGHVSRDAECGRAPMRCDSIRGDSNGISAVPPSVGKPETLNPSKN
jgi:hypothetical protein